MPIGEAQAKEAWPHRLEAASNVGVNLEAASINSSMLPPRQVAFLNAAATWLEPSALTSL
jgi:hypothetical protein